MTIIIHFLLKSISIPTTTTSINYKIKKKKKKLSAAVIKKATKKYQCKYLRG